LESLLAYEQVVDLELALWIAVLNFAGFEPAIVVGYAASGWF
jgi:hypothetical protein